MKSGIVSVLLGGWILAMPGIGSAYSTSVPVRTSTNLIVAAYNIQWIGQKRHDFETLADVIEHFDVCGIMEVKDEDAIAELVAILNRRTGFEWGFTYGIRTHNPSGNYHEAYAAVWRRDRVQLSGLVGGKWDRNEAFRNDPYVVSFKRGNFDFTLLLIHTRWSNDADGSREGGVQELASQVTWMRGITEEKDFEVACISTTPAVPPS